MNSHRSLFFRLLLLVVLGLTACSSVFAAAPGLDFTTRNSSKVDLDWVRVTWGEWQIPSGILGVGIYKVQLNTDRREPPKTDVATVTFVEESSRQRHTIQVDMAKVREAMKDGVYMVTFDITALDHADVTIKQEKK